MSPYRKNVLVGVTVLAAMLILGWMIIQFGGSLATPFQADQMKVRFVADRADGINTGTSIKYLGQTVGTVKMITLDIAANDVKLEAEIDRKFALPGKLNANIIIPNFLGTGSIIDLSRADPTDLTRLTEGTVIQAKYVGISIIPPDVAAAFSEIKLAVAQFRESNVVGDLKLAVNNFNQQVGKAGALADSLNAIVGSEQGQKDLKQSIEDFRATIADARKTAANVQSITARLQDLPDRVDKTMGQIDAGATDARAAIADARVAINNTNERITKLGDSLIARSEQLARTLADVQQVAEKVNKGQGTAGALVNDPKLYDTLVNATQELNETIKDVKRVANQIEQEGFKLKF
ncbi:MAG: MlaD family protein [Tepidisphaeraceae bacterium]